MAEALYLFEVAVEPTSNPSLVVTQALVAIDRGVQRAPNASRLYAFKVSEISTEDR